MDSTEFNKIAGAALGALLIFLLLNFFSGQIYGTREAGGHHGEEVLAFALAVETAGEGGGEAEPQVDYAALVAAADPAAGESVFRACGACHKVEEGVNGVGPSLWGVVGRDVASVEGFGYSDALMTVEGDWTLTDLSGFLADPKGWAPGTKMSYAGLKDAQDRVDVIAYLNEADGSPVDLAEGLEPVAAVGDAGTAVPDPSLSPGVGEGQGVNPPGEAAEGAPASGESAGIESPSEAAAVEEPEAEAVVTGTTTVDNTAEGAEVPTSPAAETHEAERTGEDILRTPDPTPTAPAQQEPGTLGAPGEGATPLEGAPGAAGAETDAATTEQEPPAERVEGEDAPPLQPPGQAPQEESEPAVASEQASEAPAAAAQQEGEAPAADSGGEQLAAAPAATPAAGGTDFSSGDAAAGEKLFRRCVACHKVEEGKNGVGPHLWGVVGRDVAAVEGFNYSDAMKAHEGQWTAEHLSAYLENPKAVVPGTKMAFAGLKDAQDRIDIITYLNEADGSPEPLQ